MLQVKERTRSIMNHDLARRYIALRGISTKCDLLGDDGRGEEGQKKGGVSGTVVT